jgi:putative FmdB family regulatory protein
MPLYDYDCSACGRRFEVVHGVFAERPTVCPICGSGPIRKAISAAAVHYKGSGWAKKERRATASSGTAKKASGEGDGSDGGAKSDESGSSSGATPVTATKSAESGSGNKTDTGSKSAESGSGNKTETGRKADTASRTD